MLPRERVDAAIAVVYAGLLAVLEPAGEQVGGTRATVIVVQQVLANENNAN